MRVLARWGALAISAVFALSSVATAGDYHKDGTLLCSQCHIMHYSQSHGYNPDGSGFFLNPGAGGPFEFLLRDEINSLCLACHDEGGIAPDVFGPSNGGNGPTDIRNAGYLNSTTSGEPATGHTLYTTDTAPGSDPPWDPGADGLNCVDCHHQHGYGGFGHPDGGNQYRNLLSNPGNGSGAWVTYNWDQIGTNDLTKDVFERQMAEYDESDMDWNEPDNTNSAIGNWCGGCHTNFHGTPGDANIGGDNSSGHYEMFLRHPVAGVNIGEIGGGHSNLTDYNERTNKVKVMSEVGVWDPAGTDVTPTCISCHKAHGNGNAFGLIYRSGGGTKTENGDTLGTRLEHLCGQCHVQAGFFQQS